MNQIDPMETVDVVAVAAHPDDLEIACGGTLARLALDGYRVAMVDLTSGEPTPRGTVELRRREAEAARVALGVPFRWNLDLPNRELMDTPEARTRLAIALRRLRPSLVITPAGGPPGTSPDHAQVRPLVDAACFYSQLTKWEERFEGTVPHTIKHVAYVPSPWELDGGAYAGRIVSDVTDTWDRKLSAIECYASQFDAQRFEGLVHVLRGWAASAGTLAGFPYGELFALARGLGTTDLFASVTRQNRSRTNVP